MKRLICCLVAILMMNGVVLCRTSAAQDASHTARQELLLKQPRTVMRDAREAVELARNEGKSVELIDALMQLSAARLLIDADSIVAIISDVNSIMNNCRNAVDRSVIAIYLCQLYSQNLMRDYGAYTRPYLAQNNDISTWNERNYQNAIDSLCCVALQSARQLQKTPLARYRSVMTVSGYDGDDSWLWAERFYPTMYDFVVENVVSLLTDVHQKEKIIDDALAYHKKRDAARLMLDLKKIEIKTHTDSTDVAVIDSLILCYAHHDYVIEAVVARENILPSQVLTTLDARRERYDTLQEWIARYPHYYRTDCLRQICSMLSRVEIGVSMSGIIHTSDSVKIDLSYSNANSVAYTIYRCQDVPLTGLPNTYAAEKLKDMVEVQRGNIDLCVNGTLSFDTRNKQITLPPLPEGVYKVQFQSGTESATSTFVVTPYMLFSIGVDSKQVAAMLVDGNSGRPIEGETVKLLSSDGELLQTAVTDTNGLCLFSNRNSSRQYAVVLDNISRFPLSVYTYFHNENDNSHNRLMQLFTDRSIYRPGQILHYSVLMYRMDDLMRSILSGEEIVLTLRDAAHNVVYQDTLITDDYGTAFGSIDLPIDAAMGNWCIDVKGKDTSSSQWIMVSEYKRPQFYVECNDIEGTYTYGDTIEVTGRAVSYTGIPLAYAPVRYSVERSVWYNGYRVEMVSDSTTTDGEGHFAFSFVANVPDETLWREWGTRYVADVVVTSSTGESQNATTVVSVSGTTVFFRPEIPEKLCKETAQPFDVAMVNGEGTKLLLPMCVELYSLQTGGVGTPLDKLSVDSQCVWHHDYTASENCVALPYDSLTSGAYRLVMSTHDLYGNLVKDTRDFVLYSIHDMVPPVPTALWIPITNQTVADNDTATFVVGSSYVDASLLCIVKERNSIVDIYRVELNEENKLIELPYKGVYGDVVSIHLILVHDKEMYQEQLTVYRHRPNTQLTVTPSTFRDRTVPGDHEIWRFTVRDADGKPVKALFMAEMYDASLDAVNRHSWNLHTNYNPAVPYVDVMFNHYNNRLYEYLYYAREYRDAVCHSVPNPVLYTYLGNMYYNGLVVRGVGGRMMMNKYTAVSDAVMPEMMDRATVEESAVMNDAIDMQADVESDTAEQLHTTPIVYRENMAETAFFYPHLVTDDEGNVVVEFTLPESNTMWNFFSLAVTPNLYSGKYDTQVISSKPLMVSPNMPRFLCQGDRAVLSVAIQNTTSDTISGSAYFTLFNPEDDSIIKENIVAVNVDANGVTTVDFELPVPDTLLLLGVRVGVSTSRYSDGEQHLVVCLPSRQMITETKPFFLNPNVGDTTIVFTEMIENMQRPSVENYRVTLEYCDNPAWYAVTALPALSNPTSESATALMAALYANTVAGGIVRQNRDVAAAIAEWSQTSNVESAISQLMKNEEMKQIVLSQTPWILDAANATQQMQQLALLLDSVRVEEANSVIVRKLKALQDVDGGWSWFKSMHTSYELTLNILSDLSRLKGWGETHSDEAVALMVTDALRYIDNEYVRRSDNCNNVQSYIDLRYLYVRSNYIDVPMNDKLLPIHRNQLTQLASDWYKLNEIEKAYAAIVLYRYGYVETAQEVVTSLREYATVTASQGMFWANNRSDVYNFTSAIQVHCAIYEAFETVAYNTNELDAMRQWLLLQKQTQSWGSVPSTVDATRILLSSGSNWLGKGLSSQLIWGDKPLPQVTDVEQTCGYEKYVRQNVGANDAIVKVENHNSQPSWGAIYWQYYDQVSEVDAQGNDEIKISREYYVQRGGSLIPIDSTTVCVGDEIMVYLKLYTQRDMQFVVLTDLRPACFEPVQQLPQYHYQDGVWYYVVPSDTDNTFYFNNLSRGTHVLQYRVYADRQGVYQAGTANFQSYYAPQYVAHSAGLEVCVKKQ